MSKPLKSAKDIQKITNRLLKKSDAYGVFPTPVDQIIDASGLTEVEENLFDESLLSKVPSFLRQKVEKLKYKVLAAIDRREKLVYINYDHGNEGSITFRRLHEVTHDVLPWQGDLGYADDNQNLLPSIRNLFEQEANYGAAELLFQNEKFTYLSADYQVSISSVIELANTIGSSIHAAMRRYTETHSISIAAIALQKQNQPDPEGVFVRNEIIVSEKWIKQLPDIRKTLQKYLKIESHQFLQYALQAQNQPNKIINGKVDCKNLNGDMKNLNVEVLNTTHHIHVLICCLQDVASNEQKELWFHK